MNSRARNVEDGAQREIWCSVGDVPVGGMLRVWSWLQNIKVLGFACHALRVL